MDRQGPPSGRSVYDDYTTGFNIYTFWDICPRNSLRSGVTFKRDVHKEHMDGDPEDKLASHTWSLALEDVAHLTDNLTLTGGASYDIFEQKERDQPSDPDASKGDDVKSFNPQVGLSYDFSDAVNICGSIARKIRFPTMRNLYSAGVLGPQGDPDLKEQRTINYELGGSWEITDNTTLEAALFFSNIRDYIYFDNVIGRFEQLDRSRIYGFEPTLSSLITPRLFARLSYTFMKTDVVSDVTLENKTHDDLTFDMDEIPYHPQHKIDFDLTQSFSFGTEINLNGSFISSQKYIDYQDPNDNQRMIADKEDLSSYLLLNTKVSQQITKQFQVYLAVENLLNKDYFDLYLLPSRGITAWAGMKFEL